MNKNKMACYEHDGKRHHCFPSNLPVEGEICNCGQAMVIAGVITKSGFKLSNEKHSR